MNASEVEAVLLPLMVQLLPSLSINVSIGGKAYKLAINLTPEA